MHRCLLISEVFFLILDFVQQYGDSPEEVDCDEGHALSKRTLASLARTCRAFSAPALDRLWMHLDSLDPLIRVLPSRIWAKKHSRFIVRMLMKEKHWFAFRRYATRVRSLQGPCRGIPPSVQRNVVTALARFPKDPFSLLPNLMELVWSESDSFSVIDPTVTLIKFFAGIRVTSVSLFLVSWPIYESARTVLANLPSLFPNVTSFTAIPRATINDYTEDVTEIVRKWSNLRDLRTCALPQAVMDEMASHQTLNTLGVELSTSYITDVYMDRLPSTLHTFSLRGSTALLCARYLQRLQGNPTSFRLHVGLDLTPLPDMDGLFRMLPTRFDAAQLQNLTISTRSSSSRSTQPHACSLTEPLLAHLYAFSSLATLDMNSFCTSELDDAAYARWAGAWPRLRSLKVGADDVSRAWPKASVGAVISVLRSCPQLHTLHIVFDGTIPPPRLSELDSDGVARNCEESMLIAGSQVSPWGVSNRHITHIHVGHSPAGVGMEGMKDLALCLKSVMPCLQRIQSTKGPPNVLETFQGTPSWPSIQRLLLEDDNTQTLQAHLALRSDKLCSRKAR